MPRSRAQTPPTKRRPNSDHQSVFGIRSVGTLDSEQGSSSGILSPLLRRSRFSSAPLVEVRQGDNEGPRFPHSVELPRRRIVFYADSDSESSHSGGGLCSMTDVLEGGSKDGNGSPSTQPSVRIKHVTRSSDRTSRFPKLDECAHFHYDNVELGPVDVSLLDERPSDQPCRVPSVGGGGDGTHTNNCASSLDSWWCARVCSNGRSWEVKRSLDNFLMLDRQLHCCVYERKFSGLTDLTAAFRDGSEIEQDGIRAMLTEYLERFSQLAGSLINCGPVLNWLELDNRGFRLIVTDEAAINTPAVAAAYVTKRYAAQANDEIHLEVGDIISVIDMPPPDESTWWRAKKGFQVGFFPSECVEIIGDKVPQTIKIPKAKPVLRKHGKLIAFFRQFLLSRPSRRKLKQSGILKERVFGCDLGEHLMNSARDIPLVLKCCAEFIEEYGIVDGIYRLSGVTSNIQKLRLAFDEDRIPNLMDEAIIQDIHCVASLLKMYFRELPNPLLTFHLYDKFVHAVQADESIRLLKLRDVVQQLPPPHYRSLEYLMRHLSKVAAYGSQTGMTPKNVAIVWAPNLLREIENGGVGALHVVGVQAVLTEYLIRYTDIIFSEKMPTFPSPICGDETPKKIRPKSLAISTPTKLLSLEEARSRALACSTAQPKFIEVGGGVESLPTKYHTIIDVPGRRSGGKGKKSPLGWRSFFSRGWHTTSGRSKGRRSGPRPKISSPIFVHHSPLCSRDEALTELDICHLNTRKLRTVKSAESLLHLGKQLETDDSMGDREIANQPASLECTMHESEYDASSTPPTTPTYQKHMRSTSHDSYFEHLEMDSYREVDEEFVLRRAKTSPLEECPNDKGNIDEKDGAIIITKSDFDEVTTSNSARTSQKQKLVSFESGVSSPKVQKLSLKRMRHSLSSPPMVRRKDTSEEICVAQGKQRKTKSRRTNSVDKEWNNHQAGDIGSTPSRSSVSNSSAGNSLISEDMETEGEQHPNIDSFPSDDDSPYGQAISEPKSGRMSVSMEATLSETIGVSQLLSFESKDNIVFSPQGINRDDTYEAFSAMPLDNSLDTQESPTTDNLSDMPSCDESDFNSSPGDIEKLEKQNSGVSTQASSFRDCSAARDCGRANPVDQKEKSELSDKQCNKKASTDEEVLAKQTSTLQIDVGFPMETLKSPIEKAFTLGSPSMYEGLILSPPENFSNNKSRKSPSGSTKKVENSKGTNALGIPENGKDLNSVIQDWCESSLPSKKRHNDKISPISPVEESRRRFESEIGRLIVRDRQMRLEMEQMKAERQKCNQKQDVSKKSAQEPPPVGLKTEKKLPNVSEARKSPVKKRLVEMTESFTSQKDNQENKKVTDWSSSPVYSHYVRMENKPSVKELMSKFEVQQKLEKDEKNGELFRSPPRIRSNVFSNVQVINHDSREVCAYHSESLPSCERRGNEQSRDHIFQTECVVRFPHPKTSSVLTSTSPHHKTDESSTFLNSYLRSKSDFRHTFPMKHPHSPSKTSVTDIFSSSDTKGLKYTDEKNCDALAKAQTTCAAHFSSDSKPGVRDSISSRSNDSWSDDRPGDLPAPTGSNGISENIYEDTKPSVKLKKKFLENFAQFEEKLQTVEADRMTEVPSHEALRTTARRMRSSPSKQRPRSVPPPICRFSITSSVRPSVMQVTLPVTFHEEGDNVPNTTKSENPDSGTESSHTNRQPRRKRDKGAPVERSRSFSGFGDCKGLSIAPNCQKYKNSNNKSNRK